MHAEVCQYTYMQPLCIQQSHAQCARISERLFLTADLIQALRNRSIVCATLAVLVGPFYILMLCRYPADLVTAVYCWNWLPT